MSHVRSVGRSEASLPAGQGVYGWLPSPSATTVAVEVLGAQSHRCRLAGTCPQTRDAAPVRSGGTRAPPFQTHTACVSILLVPACCPNISSRRMTKPHQPRRRAFNPLRCAKPLVKGPGALQFSGLQVLNEYDGAAGLVLWQALRDAELWALAHRRTGLFHHAADTGPLDISQLPSEPYGPIKPALAYLSRLSRQQAADAATVAASCDSVASWSQNQGHLGTAVEYQQVASFADQHKAIYAVRTGRWLRMRAEYARAWSWFEYGISVARREQDSQAYCEAYAGIGNLHVQVGNYPRARVAHRRVLRAARRSHIPEMVASAYHNLFVIEMEVGDFERAEELATRALRSYPLSSPARPRLARDLALRWTLLGYFERALPLLQEVLPHFSAPAERALVWSDIARAAAGSGAVESFEDAWAQARVLLSTHSIDPWPAAILVNLAHAAAFLGERSRAEWAAARAAQIAAQRKESTLRLAAEVLVADLHCASPG
jgi:tetratricopeptide (TPR) repeat protein